MGFGFILLTVPINGVAAKRIMGIRRYILFLFSFSPLFLFALFLFYSFFFLILKPMVGFTDARVKTTNEILQAIKIVKLYAWEDSFAQKVTQTRTRELNLLRVFARTVLPSLFPHPPF